MLNNENRHVSLQFSAWLIIILNLVKHAGLKVACTLVAGKTREVQCADEIDRIANFYCPVSKSTQPLVALFRASITALRAILMKACLGRVTIGALASRVHIIGLALKLKGITIREITLTAWKDIVCCLQYY